MGRTSTVKRSVKVTVLGPGLDPRQYSLPEGATLADLLREAGDPVRDLGILIDGQPIEEVTTLKSGTTITLANRPSQVAGKRSWMDSVGTVQDTPAFREMIAAGRAIRDADTEATRDSNDRDDE